MTSKGIFLFMIFLLFISCEKDKPTVVTSDIVLSSKYISRAQCGGIVKDNGGSPVTSRGVCWNKTGNPSLTNYTSYTMDGNGTGKFVSNLSALEFNTNYYIRAYATNDEGTGYGNEINFTTYSLDVSKPCEKTPTVTDYDGNVYKTVRIGDQCWMAENLRSTHYANGESITGDYSVNPTNDTVYGRLYNWHAVMHDDTGKMDETDTIGIQGICPDGWHVPSGYEWNKLLHYLGQHAGGMLKESGLEHWASPNEGANNITEFTALPAGYIDGYGDHQKFSKKAYYWYCFFPSNEEIEDNAFTIIFSYNHSTFETGISSHTSQSSYYLNLFHYASVRCIKDK